VERRDDEKGEMNDWILSKHTDDPVWCWRVVNRTTGDWHGFGLTVADAIDLCRRLANDPRLH
jgi:hypothetical protein